MDLKFFLLFACMAVASADNCRWMKSGAYAGMMVKLMFYPDRDTICESIKNFITDTENSTCFSNSERNVLDAFKESCDSQCNLSEVAYRGKYVAINLSLNTEKHKSCVHFPFLNNLLKQNKCVKLHQLLLDMMDYCDKPPCDDTDDSVTVTTQMD